MQHVSAAKLTQSERFNIDENYTSTDKLKSKPQYNSNEKKSYFVPHYAWTLYHLASGNWLNINDFEEEGAKDQMMGENTNLSLICALIFTVFIPLYYTEPARMLIPQDGLTLQIYNGMINSWQEIQISSQDIHDWFDSFYIIASAGACFGTLVSVFYMLGVNECVTDAKVMVLRHYLGRVSIAPFYFFAIGIVSWAVGGFLQLVLSPQTLWGFIFKFVVTIGLILVVLLLCLPKLVQGVYAANVEQELNPPFELSQEEIDKQVESFVFGNHEKELSLKNCLNQMHPVNKKRITDKSYRIPINMCTQLLAKKAYVLKLAQKTGMTPEEVKFYLKLE